MSPRNGLLEAKCVEVSLAGKLRLARRTLVGQRAGQASWVLLHHQKLGEFSLNRGHRIDSLVTVGNMGGCQNYGPLLGPLSTRCRIVSKIQKATIILTTTHIHKPGLSSGFGIIVVCSDKMDSAASLPDSIGMKRWLLFPVQVRAVAWISDVSAATAAVSRGTRQGPQSLHSGSKAQDKGGFQKP